MPTVETVRSTADLARELERIPDSAHVDWATAALLINTAAPPSRRTMERWRQGRTTGANAADSHDFGPPFVPGVGRTARVTYSVGALRAWLKARGAASTMEVSARRGLTFATLNDAWRAEPWIVSRELIVGHALTSDEASVVSALQGNDALSIDVMPLASAMTDLNWATAEARRPFHEVWEMLLDDARNAARARAAYAEMEAAFDQPPNLGGAVCPYCGSRAHTGGCRL